MKSETLITIITSMIWGLLLAVEALTFYLVMRLDMLPWQYMLILAALLLLVWIGFGTMLFARGKTGRIGTARRVVAMLLIVLVAFGCAGVCAVISDVRSTVSAITNPGEVTTLMTVYVLQDDPAQSVEDAAGYTFGMLEGYESAKSQQAVASLQNMLGAQLNTAAYTSAMEMAGALYEKNVGAIIMSSAYVGLLEDNPNYSDFATRTRTLYEIPLTQTVVNNQPEADVPEDTAGATKPQVSDKPAGDERIADITNTPFLVYISGSDTRSTMLTTSRSDVNILAAVNPETKQVLLLNTPRDYYIPNPAGGGSLDKLTHCGVYGIDCSMDALANLYSEQIDYYAQINFTGFETLIDAIGGVTIYSDYGFTACNEYFIEQGENHLSGAAALAFARERKHLPDGDNDRGKNQMKMIKAVISQMTSGTAIANYSGILESLEGMFITDFSSENISKLVKMQLSDMASWNVLSYAVTGNTGSAVTYSMPGEYLSVMFCDDDMVAFGSSLIDKVFAGEILTEQDVVYPG